MLLVLFGHLVVEICDFKSCVPPQYDADLKLLFRYKIFNKALKRIQDDGQVCKLNSIFVPHPEIFFFLFQGSKQYCVIGCEKERVF